MSTIELKKCNFRRLKGVNKAKIDFPCLVISDSYRFEYARPCKIARGNKAERKLSFSLRNTDLTDVFSCLSMLPSKNICITYLIDAIGR